MNWGLSIYRFLAQPQITKNLEQYVKLKLKTVLYFILYHIETLQQPNI